MAFPTVQARTTNRTANTNTTSHPITLPAGVLPGELLLAVLSVDGNPTVTDNSATWTKLGQASNTTVVTGAVFWRRATGSDALTLTTSALEASSHASFRLTNAGTPTGTSANGSSTNSDPPLHTPAGGAQDFLWMAARAGDSTTVATAAPTNYTQLQTLAAAGNNGASVNTAERSLNAASENPGTFTSATAGWVAWTLSVPPATGQSRTMAVVASTATVGEPQLQPTLTVTMAVVASTATVGLPQLQPRLTVTMAVVASTATVGLPQIVTAQSVTMAVVASTATVGLPTLVPQQFLSPTAAPSTATVGLPTLVPQQFLSPTVVASTATVGLPSALRQSLLPATVNSRTGALTTSTTRSTSTSLAPSTGAERVLAPVVSLPQTVVLARVESTHVIYDPTLITGAYPVFPLRIEASSTVSAPTLATLGQTRFPERVIRFTGLTTSTSQAPSATLATRSGGATVGAPTVLNPSEQTVSPALLVSTAVVGAPTVSAGQIAALLVGSTAIVGEPTITVTLNPVVVAATTVVGAPEIAVLPPAGVTLMPVLIGPDSVAKRPAVIPGPPPDTARIALDLILSTAVVGTPDVGPAPRKRLHAGTPQLISGVRAGIPINRRDASPVNA